MWDISVLIYKKKKKVQFWHCYDVSLCHSAKLLSIYRSPLVSESIDHSIKLNIIF